MLSCSGMFTFLVIVVVVVLVVTRANQARARGGGGGRRLGGGPAHGCPACGEAHPPFAQFCRRCGRRLP